ncbi:kexin [Desulfobotulus alkaliphilus]|uniref:Kexin n=1 Tax=Desulfobotulus alkaliphilus TaxID=622671 RepID=A0A562S5X5_9BACT|nr:S8 family serine peptidase [Desulfobotulus alkaliphilus]TWI76749.1 kexin [Desulfobotulus alkaliphilus]
MKIFRSFPCLFYGLIFALLLFLAACSGSSSDSASTHPVTPPDNGGDITIPTNPIPNDPLFAHQWHLQNTGQSGRPGHEAKRGEDLNILPLWENCPHNGGCRGKGVVVAIVDDGLDINHEDLKDNILTDLNYDFVTHTPGVDPAPVEDDDAHGTAVAGIIAARHNNHIGVTGIAGDASLAGYNVLAIDAEGSDEALAMTLNKEAVWISNNSWGPPDSGHFHVASGLWEEAIEEGLRDGRDGKGIIYLWAAGNGAEEEDRSDYDEMATFHGVMAIGALNAQGKRASYSEPGSNVLVSGFAGEYCNEESDGLTITTTDLTGPGRGYNTDAGENASYELANRSYTRCFNGTSAATPTVAGVVALMLEANPSLTWRDVRKILITTARQNDSTCPDWSQNGAGYRINENYGFGAVDADKAVRAAVATQQLLPAQIISEHLQETGKNIPAGESAVSNLRVDASGINKAEFIAIYLTLNVEEGADIGDIGLSLTGPFGTVNTLAKPRFCWDTEEGDQIPCGDEDLEGFRFGSVRHFGENPNGEWTLSIDNSLGGTPVVLGPWGLEVYGY